MEGLSEAQRAELNAAIVEYLEAQGGAAFAEAAVSVRRATGIPEGLDVRGAGPRSHLLARKWNLVSRLQRQVMELERQVGELGAPASAATEPSTARALIRRDFLPKRSPALSLEGHRRAILGVALHPTQPIVVTCGEDATLRVWDCDSGSLLHSARGHTDTVSSVAFDPSGELLASASNDSTARVWEFGARDGSLSCRRTLAGHEHAVTGVTFFAGGTRVATASRDATLRVWDPRSGASMGVMRGHTEWVRRVASVAITAPIAASAPTVPQSSTSSSSSSSLSASSSSSALAAGSGYSPASSMVLLASCSSDKTVRVWDGDALRELATLVGHTSAVECVALCHPSGSAALRRALVAASTATAGATASTDSAAASGTEDASGDDAPLFVVSGDRDASVIVWDLRSRSSLVVLTGHTSWIRGVAFHPCGHLVLSVSEDQSLRVWDIAHKSVRSTIDGAHADAITSLAVHARLPVIVTASADGVARVWQCT